MIWQRLKNLWKLSAYEPEHSVTDYSRDIYPHLKKVVSTVESKPATIVDLTAKDPFDVETSQ